MTLAASATGRQVLSVTFWIHMSPDFRVAVCSATCFLMEPRKVDFPLVQLLIVNMEMTISRLFTWKLYVFICTCSTSS